jgi:hypothetical protein
MSIPYRAQTERPGYNDVQLGMTKARCAIENSLSACLDFMEMKNIIEDIIKDEDNGLGYELAPVKEIEFTMEDDPYVR